MKGIFDGVFASDDRAVAPVLGVALLFAIAAIGLSAWQTGVVPQQNAEVEFNHYSEIQEDMNDVRQAHQKAVSSGDPQSPTLQLGATYNSRIIGVNPPNPQGNLESQKVGNFQIDDAPVATSGGQVDTEDVCGESTPHTDELRYDPSYNRLSDEDTPPVVYESTVVYREAANGELLVESDQTLIQGSNINILPVQSEAQRSGRSTTLSLSSQGYHVEKTLEETAAPKLIVPTNLPPSKWEELLAAEMSGPDPYVNGVAPGPEANTVTINLAETPGQFPWTVRCAITTDGETTTFPNDVDTPPEIKNGGVGHGGTTEHTVDSNQDELVLTNGKWIDVDSISKIRFGPSEETNIPNQGGFNGGQGMGVKFRIEGESGETVYVQTEVTGEPGNWQAKKVKMRKDPGSSYQGKSLTPEAAKAILETGEPDILDVDNYKASSFQTQDGNFGSFFEEIQGMENATIHITDLYGRVDMQVISSELSVEIADADKTQTYVYNNTSSIDFDVTASGVTDGSENVDLKVRDSQGQQLDSTKPRVDRHTLSGLDGGSEDFTLTWEPEWGSLSSGTSYEILAKGESDQAFATVQVLQQDSAFIEVELLEYNDTVEYGDNLTAKARATNLGDADKTDNIKVNVDGNCCPSGAASESVDLAPGESETVTLKYDTSNLDTDSIGEVEVAAKSNNFNSKDNATANITGTTLIQEPFVEDVRAGRERLNHSMGFTLGEDTGGAKIKIDLTDTGDAVIHDGNSDGNWTVVEGNGSIGLNTNNNQVTSVNYQTNSTHDRAGDPIRIRADYTDTTDADTDAVTRYDVEYELTSTNNYPTGETNSTSFNTTLGEDIRVDIVDSGSPVEYGDTLTTTVRLENVGGASGDSPIQLSLAGTPGSNETVEGLAPGESRDVTMSYDTDQVDPFDIGEAELEAESRDDATTETVTIESPIIEKPFVEDVRAGRERLNHSMGFTLGEDTGGAKIKIDLTDTDDAVKYDGNSDGNWTVVEGNGSISLNTDNGVTSVNYQTNSTHDRAGDPIRIRADYTDTTDADTDAVTRYDVEYELTNANNYPTGETNSTSFNTTLGEDIRVDIVDSGSPVEYGDDLATTVEVENVGGATGGSSVELSLAGTAGPEETVEGLAPGESREVTLTYDTDQLEPSDIGEAELEAETRDDTATGTVTIESPVIQEPFAEDLQAGRERLNHSMAFTIGDDIGQATIKINLTDTGGNVSHDGNSANWTVVEGNGSINNINTVNNRVTNVEYQTNSTHDREGDRIVLEADYTDTTDAEAGVSYDVTYELTSADDYPQGETNSTTFGTTE